MSGFKPSTSNVTTLNSIIRFYSEAYSISKGSTGESLRFNGASKSLPAFRKTFTRDKDGLRSICGKKGYRELIEDVEEALKLDREEDATEEVANMVFGKMRKIVHLKDLEKHVGKTDTEVVKAFDFTSIIPIIDITSTQKAMFNKISKNVVHEVTYEAYKEWLSKQENEIRNLYNTQFTPAKVDYNPRVSGGYSHITTDDGQEVIEVNSHNTPHWRREEIGSPELPPIFRDLMLHLFPEDQSRQYVYTWIYHMMDTRSPMHLLLHSQRGVGKNSLVYILEELIGSSNYYYVKKDFFENNFDGELRHRRLIYFDEHVVKNGGKHANLSEFKQYHEPMMAYHCKGMPILGVEKNHASHIISNNTEEINHLVYDARRFSVPQITDISLMDAWGKDKVLELHRIRKDKKFLANIGWWVLKNAPIEKFERDQPFKSDLFYDIVDKCLFDWQRVIIETIKSKEEDSYDLDALKDEATDGGKGRINVEEFLKRHLDRDGKPFGTLVKTREGSRRVMKVIPSDKYMPEDVKPDEVFTEEFNEHDLEF